jgi:hypothetical protein
MSSVAVNSGIFFVTHCADLRGTVSCGFLKIETNFTLTALTYGDIWLFPVQQYRTRNLSAGIFTATYILF